MSRSKARVTVTIDPALVEAANEAVAAGRAASLSGWVNLALSERAAKERHLQAMADALSAYEAEFGVIAPAELVAQARADRASAVVVRARAGARAHRRGRGAR